MNACFQIVFHLKASIYQGKQLLFLMVYSVCPGARLSKAVRLSALTDR